MLSLRRGGSRLALLALLGGALHDHAGPAPALAGVPHFHAMKCEACEAIVDELDTTLREETTKVEGRMDMDLLSRLDSKGKRQGKVVNYEMSELRAMEVLEKLCEGVNHYRTVENAEANAGRGAGRFWFSKMEHYHDRGTVEIPEKEHEEGNKRALKNFCAQLVEEYEDELTAVIRRGTPGKNKDDPKAPAERRDWLMSTPLHKELCVDTARYCAAAHKKGEMGWFRKDPIYQKLLVRNTQMGELLPRFGDAPQRTAGTANAEGSKASSVMEDAMERALRDAANLRGGKMVGDKDTQDEVQDTVNKLKSKSKKGRKKKKKKKTKGKKKAAAVQEEL